MLASVERTPEDLINIPWSRDGGRLNYAIKHVGSEETGRRRHVEFLVLYRIPAQGAYSEWLAEVMNDVWDNRLPG